MCYNPTATIRIDERIINGRRTSMKKNSKELLALGIMLSILFTGCGGANANNNNANDNALVTIENEEVPLSESNGVKEDDSYIIDFSSSDDGCVKVKYKESSKVKIKAQVKGPKGVVYTYDLKPKKWERFPLTEANGTYNVSVYKNVSGKSYALVGSYDYKVKMDDTMAPFKSPNQYVDYTSSSKCVKKANSLCKKCKTEMDKVKKVYKFTLKHFKYDKKKAKNVSSGYLPDLDKVYKAKKGICFDYASTMAAMLRSQGVPCKLVIGYAGDVYHAWINVYTKKDGWITGVIYFDGENWNMMDPTFADSNNSSKEIMEYISNPKNYTEKYIY